MKRIILCNAVFICCFQFWVLSIQAQILYGATLSGGQSGIGTINKFTPATNNLKVIKSLEGAAALPYYTTFIQASDGKLYGMTSEGGSSNAGVIFSYDSDSLKYAKLSDFDSANGAHPFGSLIQATNGKLYGMTHDGGSNGYGVIFSFDPFSSAYTNLKDFDSANGKNSYGSLLQASDGKLYGMTASGGSKNAGVVFSFDPSSSTFTKLKDFNITNGANPRGNLIQANDGKLYGMTYRGGSGGNGVIFSLDPFTFTYTKLRDFHDNISGLHPYGSLMQASDGKLYGMTTYGGSGGVGVIFSFDLSSSTYTRLRNLNSTIGANPFGNLVQASDGKLYGMTSQGGRKGYGVVFSFNPSSSTYIKLKSFDDYRTPYGSLIQAANGKLYGMTGGLIGYESGIFSFDPFSSVYSGVIDFRNTSNGSQISGGLVHASDGKLYGVTLGGGSHNSGVIFSFDPSSFAYKSLKDFSSGDGSYPTGNLIQAHDGKLYGMTQYGGINNYGVIFSFDPSSSIYTNLKKFDNTSGAYPVGSLIQASDGKLYGMTQYGGNSNAGVIFSFDLSSSTYTKLKDFDYNNGGYPPGSPLQASDGKLYGMAGGGKGFGVIFSFDPSSSTYTKLKDFDGTHGAFPGGSFMQASDGKIYGTTLGGGYNGHGVLFSFDPLAFTYEKLKDFYGGSNGSNAGSLMQASDGKLYGMTSGGGSADLGVIFSFDPLSSIHKKLKDFNGANGAKPNLGATFVELKDANIFPTVNITRPTNNATYAAYPYAKIKLNADASDADGTISKVEFYSGNTLLHTEHLFPYEYAWDHVAVGNYILTAKATDNNGNVTTSDAVHISVKPDIAPIVNITSPGNGASYTPYSMIILSADANDADGTVKKVDFFNGNTLIFTETIAPYERKGYRLPLGNYYITAKATDNNGRVTASQPVAISVVPDKAPVVSIISPVNNTTYVAPATIILSADASDVDGTIKKVDFYNGNTLLFTENDAPYFRSWADVPEGNYSITAIATDNNGKTTTSTPIAISVIAAGKSMVTADKLNSSKEPLSLNLNPNPVANILNISVHGLQTNNRSTISVLSVSGAVIKTMQPGALNKTVQLDVSSLSVGIYFIKVINGDKILYKQFVKF